MIGSKIAAIEYYLPKNKENNAIFKKNNPNFGCVTNAGIDGHTTTGHIFSFVFSTMLNFEFLVEAIILKFLGSFTTASS